MFNGCTAPYHCTSEFSDVNAESLPSVAWFEQASCCETAHNRIADGKSFAVEMFI
jgi:hypothetical protein